MCVWNEEYLVTHCLAENSVPSLLQLQALCRAARCLLEQDEAHGAPGSLRHFCHTLLQWLNLYAELIPTNCSCQGRIWGKTGQMWVTFPVTSFTDNLRDLFSTSTQMVCINKNETGYLRLHNSYRELQGWFNNTSILLKSMCFWLNIWNKVCGEHKSRYFHVLKTRPQIMQNLPECDQNMSNEQFWFLQHKSAQTMFTLALSKPEFNVAFICLFFVQLCSCF